MIVRDNDGADCVVLKKKLQKLCSEARRDGAIIRIACDELEAWYFGDLGAVARAFAKPKLLDLAAKERYREPDSIRQPADALSELVPEFQKLSGARRMALELGHDNKSSSYRVMMRTLSELEASV